MIDPTLDELLAFYAGKDGEYAIAVKLRLLRQLVADLAAYRRECEQLATQLAGAKAAA